MPWYFSIQYVIEYFSDRFQVYISKKRFFVFVIFCHFIYPFSLSIISFFSHILLQSFIRIQLTYW